MAAYLIADGAIADPAAMGRYVKLAGETLRSDPTQLPHVVVGKVVGFFFLMLKIVYYTILVLGVGSALSIVLGLLLIVLPGPMLLFGIVAIVCPIYQNKVPIHHSRRDFAFGSWRGRNTLQYASAGIDAGRPL